KNIDVEIINQEVVKIIMEDEMYRVSYKNKASILVDSVQLTIGHVAYNDPYQLKGYDNFTYNPYQVVQKLNMIHPEHKVTAIGCGLSALDTMMYLQPDDEDRPLDMFTLGGLARTVRRHNYQDLIDLKYVSAEKLAAYAYQLARP